MEKEKEVKLEELNDEVQSSGIPKEIHSVTVANTGAVTADSARIDILGGVARVVARNNGPYNLKVKIMYSEFVARVYKEWSVYPSDTLDTGEFSIPPNTYWLRIGPIDARLPATGSGTLYSITYI